MSESLCFQQPIMNYGGGSGNSTEGGAAGWENILLTNYFGEGGGAGTPGAGSADGAGGGGPSNPGVGVGVGVDPPGASAAAAYDSTGYAHYLGAGYPNKGNGGGGSESSVANGGAGAAPPPAPPNAYYGAPYSDAPPPATAPGINYGATAAAAGYSLTMPAERGGGYVPTYGAPAAGGGGGHPRYAYDAGPAAGGSQASQYAANVGLPETGIHQRRSSDESQTNMDPYSVDYGNYYNPSVGGGGGGVAYPPPAGGTDVGFGGGGSGSTSQHGAQQANYNPANMSEMDYCDALLRGMDDPSFGWLAGAAGLGGAGGAMGATAHAPRNNAAIYSTGGTPGHHPQGGGRAMAAGGLPPQAPPAADGGERLALPAASLPGNGRDKGGASALDVFFLAQQQQQYAAGAKKYAGGRGVPSGRTTSSSARSSSSRAAATTTSSSARLSPNQEGHSSLPSVQIDPLLERVTLALTAVSLRPLSGNQVVRHVRTKTDDVVTRFLPCVDFLVNCQQELRQGLALAQRSRAGRHGRRGGGGGMTPRQFHAAYVAPLPKRFERHNESIMAREHLRQARQSLEGLVRDAHACLPQGCDHVKNAFLGGMRENESWGLRKWLSKHGGAGSICNDLEEIIRNVKSLDKEKETTKRLAEMLRPIARQAHERLKKDVPQAYQEQSSAHPYLPFFHRLEACLKQMATYDPEEDDVICLDDSDEEDEEDVKVVVSKTKSAPEATSSAIKRRGSKSKSGGAGATSGRSPKRKTDEENDAMGEMSKYLSEGQSESKRSRRSTEDEYAESFFNNDEEEEEVGKPTAKAGGKDEPEVICLVESEDEEGGGDDDENDDDDDLGEALEAALGGGDLSPLPPATVCSPAMEYAATTPRRDASVDAGGRPRGPGTGGGCHGAGEQWRCEQCTFLNEAFASKCVMCNDDDVSSAEGGGGVGAATDDLANFLGGSVFVDPTAGASARSYAVCAEGPGRDRHDPGQWRALQSADARELETLAEHISSGGSLPKQAHRNVDPFWGTIDTFPRILMLFRTILQHPASHRHLEAADGGRPFAIGPTPFGSVVRHPGMCFHAIVSALSRSEDAVKFPHLTMRLSNGRLPPTDGEGGEGELRDWNMWNGLHLIEAIDLVLLNSLAHDAGRRGAGSTTTTRGGAERAQRRTETESLRDVLWEGVNSMLKERLQPHERRDHLPQRRSADSGFVVLDR